MTDTVELSKAEFSIVQLGAFYSGQRYAKLGFDSVDNPYQSHKLRLAWQYGFKNPDMVMA